MKESLQSKIDFFLEHASQQNTFIWNSEFYNILENVIQKCNNAYFNLQKPLISDADYDTLFILFEYLEKQFKTVNKKQKIRTSKVVGSGVINPTLDVESSWGEVLHDPPMLSLDKAYDFSQILTFIQRIEKVLNLKVNYSLLPKFDGLAVELEYYSGKLSRCSTRGNGKIGEDITGNVISCVQNIPLHIEGINIPDYISIRGECVIKKMDFLELNKELKESGKETFANPRNTVAGELRKKHRKLEQKKKIYFYPYAIGKIDSSQKNIFYTQTQMLGLLKQWKFEITRHLMTGSIHLHDELNEFYTNIYEERSNFEYDMDGIVVRIDDDLLFHRLGNTSRFPRGSIAWKFPSSKAVTQILDVSFQLGRTGILTPVADLAPINIGGVIVKRATLHNLDQIKRLNIYLKDYIEISRAGDVIPKINKVLLSKRGKDTYQIDIPEVCLKCGAILKIESPFIKCTNISCRGVYEQYLKYFVSKDAWDIRGLGEELVLQMYQKGVISDIADIFSLSLNDLQNGKLERMGDQLARNIITAIQNRKKVLFSCFLYSMNIYHLGKETAKILANHYKKLDPLLSASIEEIQELDGVGKIIATSVTSFFRSDYWKKLYLRLIDAGVEITFFQKKEEFLFPNLIDKTFVFTGILSISRDDAKDIVERSGGKVTSSISSKTSYLVYGETPGNKIGKAKKLGIEILTEEQFQNLIK